MNQKEGIKAFLKEPQHSLTLQKVNERKERREIFVATMVITFICMWLVGVFAAIFKLIWENFVSPVPEYQLTYENLLAGYGKYFFLVVAVIGPVIEETIFRLPLNFQKKNVVISFGTLWICSSILVGIYLNIGVIFLFFLSTICFFTVVALRQDEFDYIKDYCMKSLMWLSILVFSFLHIRNYTGITDLNWIVAVVNIIPIFVLALGLTFIRCRVGFWYGVLFHCIVNSFFLLSLLLRTIPKL